MFVQRKPFKNDKTSEFPDIMIQSLSPPASTELVGLSAHIRRIDEGHFIILSLYLQQKFVARCLCMLHFWLQSESCIAPSLPSAWQLNWNVCVGSAYHAMAVPGLSQRVIVCVRGGLAVIITWPTADCFGNRALVSPLNARWNFAYIFQKNNPAMRWFLRLLCFKIAALRTVVQSASRYQSKGGNQGNFIVSRVWKWKMQSTRLSTPCFINDINDLTSMCWW